MSVRRSSRSRLRPAPPWWQRPGLRYRRGHLHLGSQDLAVLAASASQPAFVYHAARIRANLARLRAALARHTRRFRIFYALKSNRFLPVLSTLRTAGTCGVDVCSPRELLLARQAGFREEEISFTATSLSDADLTVLARHPGVWVNCDSLSSLRRLGRLQPGREIGLRVNPGCGVGYRANPRLRYAGAAGTKFGIYRAEFAAALQIAATHRLRITGLHVHAGCGYLTPQLPQWEHVIATTLAFADELPGLRHLNVGGGLGIPLVADDAPLDLAAWTEIIARRVLRRGLEVWVEPGDYLVKDSGVLLLQVNTVETKNGTLFAGVNGGFNLHPEPAFYDLPLVPVPVKAPAPGAPRHRTQIAGNINEALDLLARGALLPSLAEGDWLALLNAGGYGASMSSDHCLRGEFFEYVV